MNDDEMKVDVEWYVAHARFEADGRSYVVRSQPSDIRFVGSFPLEVTHIEIYRNEP